MLALRAALHADGIAATIVIYCCIPDAAMKSTDE
jgi:hypothetical protein